MYLPLLLLGLVYFFRGVLRYFFPRNLKLRRFTLFMLAMFSLLGCVGAMNGYTRWLSFQKNGQLVSADIIFNGWCGNDPYEEGRYMRAYKHIELVEMEHYNPGYQPFFHGKPSRYNHHCVGYRFLLPDSAGVVYAGEYASGLDEVRTIDIRFDPSYPQNNWIDAYIPHIMQSSTQYMGFFAATLLEAMISTFLFRRNNGL
jgi:hypothetical protein